MWSSHLNRAHMWFLVHAYGFSVKLLFGYEVDVCRANVKFECNRQSRKKKRVSTKDVSCLHNNHQSVRSLRSRLS